MLYFYIRYRKRLELHLRQTSIIRSQIKRIGMGDISVIRGEFYTPKRAYEYG